MATAKKHKKSKATAARGENSVAQAKPASGQGATGFAAMKYPLGLTVALFLVSLSPRVQENSALTWSIWGAALFLLAWQAWLLLSDNDQESGGAE